MRQYVRFGFIILKLSYAKLNEKIINYIFDVARLSDWLCTLSK